MLSNPFTQAELAAMESYNTDGSKDHPQATSPYLNHPVRTEREAVLEAELSKARQTVRFFASVIKSGEPWTPACEEAMSAVLSPVNNGGSNDR